MAMLLPLYYCSIFACTKKPIVFGVQGNIGYPFAMTFQLLDKYHSVFWDASKLQDITLLGTNVHLGP